MKIKYIFLFVLSAVSSGTVAQQEMTLDRCREIALENNRAASIAGRTEEKAAYEVKSYRANFLPKFSASGMYLYSQTEMKKTVPGNYLPTYVPDASGKLVPNVLTVAPDGTPVFKEYAYFPDMSLALQLNGSYMAGIRAEQPLYTGGKIMSAYKMSLLGREIAQLNRHLTRTEIIVKTDEAYWAHVKATELLKLAEAYKKVVTELYRNVQDACEAGLKPKNDVLKVQVQMNRAELQLRQAGNAVRLSKKNLCHVMGIAFTTDIRIAGTDEAGVVEVARTDDYTSRPEYAMLEKQIALKDREIKLVRSDFLPSAGVVAHYGYAYGLKLNGKPLMDKASFSALFSVSIPIFQWGEGRNKIRAARAGKQIMQLQRDDISEKMELELLQALDRCEESALEVELTVRSLEQAEENMKVSRDHYEAGMETLAAYLEAQTLWQQAWMEMIQAKTGRRLNETYYLKAAGKL
jgi:outer membrane protein TolC